MDHEIATHYAMITNHFKAYHKFNYFTGFGSRDFAFMLIWIPPVNPPPHPLRKRDAPFNNPVTLDKKTKTNQHKYYYTTTVFQHPRNSSAIKTKHSKRAFTIL